MDYDDVMSISRELRTFRVAWCYSFEDLHGQVHAPRRFNPAKVSAVIIGYRIYRAYTKEWCGFNSEYY